MKVIFFPIKRVRKGRVKAVKLITLLTFKLQNLLTHVIVKQISTGDSIKFERILSNYKSAKHS